MNAHFTTGSQPGLTDEIPKRRVLALWFPYLPTERVLRQRFGRTWRLRPRALEVGPPLVISGRDRNTQRITALNERAEGLGLKRGMGLADARAMRPTIEVVENDVDADGRLLDGLADWCDRYTPLVAVDGEDGLLLDITGCAHLFGGERALLDDILARFFQQGFDARAALASTPGAAWAAARYRNGFVVEPGKERQFLAQLPLPALRLQPVARTGLESVGLKTVGALMATPRAPIVRRFGREIMLRLDQALGFLEEPISPRLPVAPLSVERHLAEPIDRIEDVESLVLRLAHALKSDFERRGEGARLLQLLLFRVDGMVCRITVGASRPLREPAVIQKLFHERLASQDGALDTGCGFDLIRLSAVAVATLATAQGDLDGTTSDEAGSLALFVDRVRARLGDEAIQTVEKTGSHIPERAVATRPWDEAAFENLPRHGSVRGVDGRSRPSSAIQRPIRLFPRPEPVEVVVAEIPEGPPRQFRWRRTMHHVRRAEGPERIAPEWWHKPNAIPTRDYFRIEDADGRRYWLYRQGFYGAAQSTPRWFMHGIFA